jgi:hypothetical protein
VRTRGRWVLAGVALAAVAVVAGFVLLLWPRPPEAMEMAGIAGPYEVRLLIETPAVGVRDVVVAATGEPVERLVVAPTMAEMGHAVPPITAAVTPDGRYLASGVELFMAGRWDVAVVVHGPGGAAEVVFPVIVTP